MDQMSWIQASLPILYGGIGVRSVKQLAPSAYLSSYHRCSQLVNAILPIGMRDLLPPHLSPALRLWQEGVGDPPLPPEVSHLQKAWDRPQIVATYDNLLERLEQQNLARLLAVSSKESGAWLNAMPIPSVGLRMEDEDVRVALGLRLGLPLCIPHSCFHCGAGVDQFGAHGLSCRYSKGRFILHNSINDIVMRALESAKISCRVEPNGILRSDGKRPDGVTVIPWSHGKSLIWDVTCPDSFAPSYTNIAAIGELVSLLTRLSGKSVSNTPTLSVITISFPLLWRL